MTAQQICDPEPERRAREAWSYVEVIRLYNGKHKIVFGNSDEKWQVVSDVFPIRSGTWITVANYKKGSAQ